MADHQQEQYLTSYWNDLNIPRSIDYSNCTGDSQQDAKDRAERLRKKLRFLERMKQSKLIMQDLYLTLVQTIQAEYGELVDSLHTENGLNNYAESITNLIPSTQNGSSCWSSKLGLDDDYTNAALLKEIIDKAKEDDPPQKKTLKYKRTMPSSPINANISDPRFESDGSETKGRHQRNVDAFKVKPFQQELRNDDKFTATITERASMTRFEPVFSKRKSFDERPIIDQPLKQVRISQGPVSSRANRESYDQRSIRANKQSDDIGRDLPTSSKDYLTVSNDMFRENKTNAIIYSKVNEGSREIEETTMIENMLFFLDQHKLQNGTEMLNEDENENDMAPNLFVTARDQYIIDQRKKNKLGSSNESRAIMQSDYGQTKKSLGTRRGTSNRFIPPVMNRESNGHGGSQRDCYNGASSNNHGNKECQDERLKNIEPRMIEMIENEIMDHGASVSWEDIAGLEFAKKTIQEIVIWPMLRPDIFTGLRGPPKGLLLFGPPGTGKTLIGKCIASQSNATFFSISASSLTSKWIGEGEKMVRALFAVARCQQSAVIFIDEIDSLLSQRTDGEHEATRRIKTEFLVQLDGATTKSEERILVVGATNRPQELDEAARRRLVKRLYIPLPEDDARMQIVCNLITEQSCSLDEQDYQKIVEFTKGYSGADMANLCREAALEPIRSINLKDIRYIRPDEVRPIVFQDFENALKNIRPSVSQQDLEMYTTWNRMYGSGGM